MPVSLARSQAIAQRGGHRGPAGCPSAKEDLATAQPGARCSLHKTDSASLSSTGRRSSSRLSKREVSSLLSYTQVRALLRLFQDSGEFPLAFIKRDTQGPPKLVPDKYLLMMNMSTVRHTALWTTSHSVICPVFKKPNIYFTNLGFFLTNCFLHIFEMFFSVWLINSLHR